MTPSWVVLHHSFTKDNVLLNDSIAIRKYHMETNGWWDIGYHYIVEKIEGIWSVSLGRPLNKAGAHCKEAGMNQKSVGVCVVGNFDASALPLDGMLYLSRFLKEVIRNHGIPAARVIGHRDAGRMAGYDWRKAGPTGIPQFKSCPGRLFPMSAVLEAISG